MMVSKLSCSESNDAITNLGQSSLDDLKLKYRKYLFFLYSPFIIINTKIYSRKDSYLNQIKLFLIKSNVFIGWVNPSNA